MTESEIITQKIKDLARMQTFTANQTSYIMDVNGLKVGFNMPIALQSKFLGDEEMSQGLPPYGKRTAFLTDRYPAAPANWMPSEGKLKSYFVAVQEGRGMWLDFNMNADHTHHLAILISIQGINPITGQPCDGIRLEQYIEKCPKHDEKFGPDRFCKKCNFKWPKQNYISTTGTPSGHFWLDGWRTADGIIRQYILTAERMRGVASNKIGEKRVYAIGISFFLSKDAKPIVEHHTTREITWGSHIHQTAGGWGDITKGGIDDSKHVFYKSSVEDMLITASDSDMCDISSPDSSSVTNSASASAASASLDYCADFKTSNRSKEAKVGKLDGGAKGMLRSSARLMVANVKVAKRPETKLDQAVMQKQVSRPTQQVVVKQLEVGAGAKISQQIYDDPNGLDFWRDIEEGTIVINYATEAEAAKILEGGTVDLEGHREGMLQGVPVGN